MLSATVSGTDIDGDTWTLRLIGPGSLVVTKQNNASLNSQTEINQITIAGAEPLVTRLIGHVTKGPNGDGKVFFQSLNELPSRSERLTGGQSFLSIVMPNFWLGTHTPSTTAPAILIPDGVNTLKFGGVDTRQNQSTTSDVTAVTLGLPLYGGTTIIIDQSISTATPTIQHAVEFSVSGRLSLFQANSIMGDPTNTPPQFSNLNPNAPTSMDRGGTFVVSATNGSTSPFLVNGQLRGGLTGQIGNLRIGGNATNLTALAFDTTGTGGAKISNFSIGGATNNVLVVAPNGLRNAVFGQDIDKTEILAHVINTLAANQGAMSSNVTVDRTISRATFGGAVVNTNVLSGYAPDYTNIIGTVTGVNPTTGTPTGTPPAPPPPPLNAQTGGGMEVHVAGNITNSAFAASVQPFNSADPTMPFSGIFGTTQGVVLPTGHISAKVGRTTTIDNSTATSPSLANPDQPTTAFFAKVAPPPKHGHVVPPHIPKPQPNQPVHAPGLHNPFRLFPFTASPKDVSIPSSSRTADPATTTGTPTPRGPLAHATAPRTKTKAKTKRP
jgi:hypothetical protein